MRLQKREVVENGSAKKWGKALLCSSKLAGRGVPTGTGLSS